MWRVRRVSEVVVVFSTMTWALRPFFRVPGDDDGSDPSQTAARASRRLSRRENDVDGAADGIWRARRHRRYGSPARRFGRLGDDGFGRLGHLDPSPELVQGALATEFRGSRRGFARQGGRRRRADAIRATRRLRARRPRDFRAGGRSSSVPGRGERPRVARRRSTPVRGRGRRLVRRRRARRRSERRPRALASSPRRSRASRAPARPVPRRRHGVVVVIVIPGNRAGTSRRRGGWTRGPPRSSLNPDHAPAISKTHPSLPVPEPHTHAQTPTPERPREPRGERGDVRGGGGGGGGAGPRGARGDQTAEGGPRDGSGGGRVASRVGRGGGGGGGGARSRLA